MDECIARAMIIELRSNEALVKAGVKDRKFYLVRNLKIRENFWIFVFQRSQIRWYRDMEIKLSSSEIEKIQSVKSVGTLGFLGGNWRHFRVKSWLYVKKDVEGTIIDKAIRDVSYKVNQVGWNFRFSSKLASPKVISDVLDKKE